MKALFKKLFGESVVYGLSGIISSFISIFLIPLYTKVFDPADYGVISLLLTTFAFLSILIIFSLDYAIAVWYWDKPAEQERKATFTGWLGFLLAAGILVGILLAALSKPLSQLYFGSTHYYTLFLLLGFNIAFAGFQKLANIWFRMLQKPFLAMFYSIGIMLVTVGCNVLFVLKMRIGVIGVFYSQAISSVVGIVLLVIFLRKWISPKSFNMAHLREMIRFAAPMVPATIMFWLMNAASVFFIKYYIKDNAQIGLFQIGMNVANVLSLFTWAFFQAWPAFAMSISKEENAKRIYSIIFEVFCVGGLFMAFALFLTSGDILMIFTNEKYIGAKNIIGILAINVILQGVPNIFAIANMITKNNKSFAIAIGIGAIISVIAFMALIPLLGKEGAALAMVCGNLFVPIYMGIQTQKIYHIPYNIGRTVLFVLIQVGLFIAAKLIGGGLIIHIIAVLVIFVVLVLLYLRVAKKAGMLSRIIPKSVSA